MISVKTLKLLLTKQGFTYLATMVIIVVIGITLSVTGYQWKTMTRREKEKELLFRGNEIRNAITQYVNSDPLRRFPHSLEDLMKDPKSSKTVRYLRKMYKDPITNDDWVLVTDPASGLIGVHSKSKEKPIKTSNFRPQDHCFEDKTHYRDWAFIVQQLNPVLPPVNALSSGFGVTSGTGVAGISALSPGALPCPPAVSSPDEDK
ncbi:MAG: type II secretion system protein [Nitrospiria bacterium]